MSVMPVTDVLVGLFVFLVGVHVVEVALQVGLLAVRHAFADGALGNGLLAVDAEVLLLSFFPHGSAPCRCLGRRGCGHLTTDRRCASVRFGGYRSRARSTGGGLLAR